MPTAQFLASWHGLGGLARLVLDQRTHVAGHRDIEFLPRLRPGADDPPLPGLRSKRRNGRHWPEDLHKCSEVIRPKVEERTSTRRIQERGIGMPQLRAGRLQQRKSREWRPDQTLLDKPAGRLETSSQEGIRRTANK